MSCAAILSDKIVYAHLLLFTIIPCLIYVCYDVICSFGHPLSSKAGTESINEYCVLIRVTCGYLITFFFSLSGWICSVLR